MAMKVTRNATRNATRAMILCAGDGRRLRPLTDSTPKPLIPIAGVSCLHRSLHLLREGGIRDVVVNARKHAEQIVAAVKHVSEPCVHVSIEEEDLDSGGGVKRALSLLGDAPFCVLNGDSIWHDDGANGIHGGAYASLGRAWHADTMDVLLLVQPSPRGMGDFAMTEDGKLYGRDDKENTTHTFIGMQMLKPSVVAEQPQQRFSLRDVYDTAAVRGRLFAVVYEGLWLHVSVPADVARIEAHLKAMSIKGSRC